MVQTACGGAATGCITGAAGARGADAGCSAPRLKQEREEAVARIHAALTLAGRCAGAGHDLEPH